MDKVTKSMLIYNQDQARLDTLNKFFGVGNESQIIRACILYTISKVGRDKQAIREAVEISFIKSGRKREITSWQIIKLNYN